MSLAKDIAPSLFKGHPWVFRQALRPLRQELAAGSVIVLELKGAAVGLGIYDPCGPIAVRMIERDADLRIDEAWVRQRVSRARALREADIGLAACTGYRVLHGENDFVPGLVLDRYDTIGVMQLDGAGPTAFWQLYRDAIYDEAGLTESLSPSVVIEEHGAQFDVDLVRGQKTGFFFDQRDNRLRLRDMAAGAAVVNLFCYTGGFSVQAALGGAQHIVSVDSAAPAVAALGRNLELNGISAASHELVVEDAFEFLSRAVEQKRTWDIVIVDPPSFARSERARSKALGAYRRLHRLAVRVVSSRGMLISASCSSHVHADDLCDVVADACNRVGRYCRVVAVTGAGIDHPVAAGFPQGRYLDCVWARLD